MVVAVALGLYLFARWYLFPRARMGMSAIRPSPAQHDGERWRKLQMLAHGASFTGILDTVVLEGITMRIKASPAALGAVIVETSRMSTLDVKHDFAHEPELAEAIASLRAFGKRAEFVSDVTGMKLTLGGPVSSADVHEACRILATLVQRSGTSTLPYR